MYLEQFGFTEKPFHITPNPRFVFLSKNHKDAFAHLLYGLQQRVGFLALIGEVGTGKTTVLRTLLGQLEENDYSLALILNPCVSAIELMETIHREFSIPCAEGQNVGQLHESLNRFLLSQREQGRTVVLVVDEAQNLQPSVLEQLRLLSNLETETDKLIQMVLVGQPELDEMFDREDLRQLKQRLVIRYRLLPMDESDSRQYVQHRLKVAGWKGGPLFSARALRRVFAFSAGTPRLINLLCDRALLVAYSQDLQEIDHSVISDAERELRQPEAGRRTPGLFRSLTVFAVVAIVATLFMIGLQTWKPPVQQVVASEVVLDNFLAAVPVSATTTDIQAQSAALQADIAGLASFEHNRQALDTMLTLWGRDVVSGGDSLPPGGVLRSRGLLAAGYHGDLEGLLMFSAPALVEVQVPLSDELYYFSLVDADARRVRLFPALSADGWIDRSVFASIWFGRALIPWINVEQIPFLTTPGTSDQGVVTLKGLLGRLGYPGLTPSGIFDEDTIRAVVRFQLDHQLAADGRVGPQTLLLLYRLNGYPAPDLPTESSR